MWATLSRFILGFAVQLPAERSDDQSVTDQLDGADRAAFPATGAVARFAPIALEDEFAFGLQLLVAGLTALRQP